MTVHELIQQRIRNNKFGTQIINNRLVILIKVDDNSVTVTDAFTCNIIAEYHVNGTLIDGQNKIWLSQNVTEQYFEPEVLSIIDVTYVPEMDATVIWRTDYNSATTALRTALSGFYQGEPDVESTQYFIGKPVAVYCDDEIRYELIKSIEVQLEDNRVDYNVIEHNGRWDLSFEIGPDKYNTTDMTETELSELNQHLVEYLD